MGLRNRLETEPERVRDFLSAARVRYLDGRHLIPSRGAAAVYLLGHSGEMLLKYAYFRMRGIHPLTMTAGVLRPALQRANHLGISEPHENYHSVLFWAELIVRERQASRNPLSGNLEPMLLWHSGRLYRNWWIHLRYRALEPDSLELKSILEAVAWLNVNYTKLWR